MIAEQPHQPFSALEVCRLCSAENRSRGGFSSPCQKRTTEVQQEDLESRIQSVIQAVDQYLNIQLKPEDGICKFCCRFVSKLNSFEEHCRRVDKMFHMAMDDQQPQIPDQNIISNWDEIRALCEIDNFTWKVVDPSDLLLLATNATRPADDDVIPNFAIAPKLQPVLIEERQEEDHHKSQMQTFEIIESGEVISYLNDLEEAVIGEHVQEDEPPTEECLLLVRAENSAKSRPPKKPLLPSKTQFECPECGKTLASRASFNTHKQSHSGGRSFQCQLCAKKFVRSDVLRNHMLTHSGQRKFGCDGCQKTFYRAADLRSHQKIHDDAKPFSCGECDKRFKRAGDLRSHNLTHERKQDFLCLICSKKFLSLGGLRYHIKVHSDERPFPCSKCDLRFRQSGNLKKHVTKAHS